MLNIDIVMLLILMCGILYTTVTDIRSGKIPNKMTFSLILLGLVFQIYLTTAGRQSILQLSAAVFGGLGIAFLMFYLGIWAPGDSKLFWSITLCLPPFFFTNGKMNYPPVVLAFNTFIPYFAVMMIYVLLKTPTSEKWENIKKVLKPRFILQLLISFFIFIGFSQMLHKTAGLKVDYFTTIIFFIILFTVLEKWIERKKIIYLFTPFTIFTFIYAYKDITFFILLILLFTSVFLVLRFFIGLISGYSFVYESEVNDLSAGCIPASVIVKDKEGGYHLKEVRQNSFLEMSAGFPDMEMVMDMSPEGLSEEKISQLKSLSENGCFRGFGDKIKIQVKQPFAPIILAGTLITLACRGVVMSALIELPAAGRALVELVKGSGLF